MTFADKQGKDGRGKLSQENFMIRGCCFSDDGRSVYLLAAKMKYKSFFVKYDISMESNGVVRTTPVVVLEIHENVATGLQMSPDSQFMSVSTSDGCVKIINLNTNKILLDE